MKNSLRDSGKFLAHYVGPMWPSALLLTLLVLGNIALQLVNPQIVRFFIDAAQAAKPLPQLVQAGIWFIVLALVQQVVSVVAVYMSENIGWATTNVLRADLVDHCLRMDMIFHNQHTPGEMIERIDGDVTTLSNLFSQFIIQIVSNGLLLIGILVLLFVEDWRAGAAIAVFVMANMVMIGKLRNFAVPHWTGERKASAALYSYIEERLSGMEDIRANAGQPYIMRHFFRLAREVRKAAVKAAIMTNIMVNSTFVMFAVGVMIAMALSAYLYFAGSLTLGGAYMIFYYTNLLRMPMDRIMQQMQDLQRGSASLMRIQELLAVRPQVKDAMRDAARNGPALPTGPLAVAFDRVSFAYQDEPAATGEAKDGAKPEAVTEREHEIPPDAMTLVLKDLSFRLPAGQVLGLLGRTGSGKTTLARLLFRFYDTTSGAVRIGADGDEIDVRCVPFEDLWQRVGMVTQNIQLFHASVRDNLTFFNDTIPDDRILAVIEELGLGAWLRGLPNGLDTELASGGASLSAGEAQLLAFTRIFLKDPGLVILDEATSRLDPATETLIEKAVERLVQNRTAIIIAHRLGTIERADQILILDEGRVMEFGAREALAADPESRFYQLLQTGLEEVLA